MSPPPWLMTLANVPAQWGRPSDSRQRCQQHNLLRQRSGCRRLREVALCAREMRLECTQGADGGKSDAVHAANTQLVREYAGLQHEVAGLGAAGAIATSCASGTISNEPMCASSTMSDGVKVRKVYHKRWNKVRKRYHKQWGQVVQGVA